MDFLFRIGRLVFGFCYLFISPKETDMYIHFLKFIFSFVVDDFFFRGGP